MNERSRFEDALLGAMLYDNTLVDVAITGGLTKEMLQVEEAELFDIILKERTKGEQFDAASISYKGFKNFDLISRCSTIENSTSIGFKDLVKNVVWESKRRSGISALKDIEKRLSEASHIDSAELGSSLGKLQAALSEQESDKEEPISMVVDRILLNLEAKMSGEKTNSIELSWGMPHADIDMLPIQRHELVVIAARPSMAKSSMAMNLALQALTDKRKVVIFTLETSKEAVLKQIAGIAACVNLRQITACSPKQIDLYKKCLCRLKETDNLRVYDTVTRLTDIESRCRVLGAQYNPDLVIIDYLGLIRVFGKKGLYEEVSEAAKAMIEARKALRCPLVLLHQLNRESSKAEREPQMHDLKDSSEVEQAASRIVFLHRPVNKFDTEEPQQEPGANPPMKWHTLLLQRKLRDGPLAVVRTVFDSTITKFIPYEKTSNQW